MYCEFVEGGEEPTHHWNCLTNYFFWQIAAAKIATEFPFLSLIIVEPMVSAGDGHDLDLLRTRLVQNATKRISEWPDREAALLYLKTRSGMMAWDERVSKVFVACGFHLFSMRDC